MDLAALSHNELIHFLTEHPDDQQAWNILISRFNEFVHLLISRECKKRGRLSAAFTHDDLAQEVYVKVAKNLNNYKGQYENSFLLYLKIITLNTVKNHYRKQNAAGRPQENKRISLHDVRADFHHERPVPIMELLPSEDWCEDERLTGRLEQIEYCLNKVLATSRHRGRDERIFHYYFIRDISVERIAADPEIDLSQQRIFGVLNEFKQKIKECAHRLERES
jgi:RNA polymerase sigma factor (sigma-70 family)